MTVCIGALARKCIILGFDKMVSGEGISSETEYKFHPLTEQLVCLYAGSPARAAELGLIYRESLAKAELTPVNVIEHLREGLGMFKRRLAESYTRQQLGMPYAEFLKNGLAWLGREEFRINVDAVKRLPLGIDLIIAGFLGDFPVLCEWRESTGKDLEWCTNFAVIGSGAYTAEPSLHLREHTRNTDRDRALYHVFEAKKTAEQDPAVGEETHLFVLSPPSPPAKKVTLEYVSETGFGHLAKLWERHRPRPLKRWPDFPEHSVLVAQYDAPPLCLAS